MDLTVRDHIQMILTLTLIGVTARYVILTGRLARSAEEQVRLGTTPSLHFEGQARMIHCEPWPVLRVWGTRPRRSPCPATSMPRQTCRSKPRVSCPGGCSLISL